MRVYLTSSDPLAAVAISCSLFMIVITSVVAGSLLPFGFAKAGVDPANAGTSIQVGLGHRARSPMHGTMSVYCARKRSHVPSMRSL